MNSVHTVNQILHLIIRQSKQKIHQNSIVNKYLTPYTSSNAFDTKNDVMLQSGVKYESSNMKQLKKQLNSQQKPLNNEKDKYSFFSVKKCFAQKKQKQQIKKQLTQIKNKMHSKKSGERVSEGNIKQNDDKKQLEKKSVKEVKREDEKKKDYQFKKLEQRKENIPKFILREEKQIGQLREMKEAELQSKETQRKRDENDSELSNQRQKKLSSYLQNHISRQNNNYTYDIQGNLLLFSHQNTKNAIKKQYPPTIRYQVQNQEEIQNINLSHNSIIKSKSKKINSLIFNNKQLYQDNHNIRGAKGEIFKSSVLKTINLSKISLGGHNNQDQMQFMKRNDLFNNNHCRQTTSIPFIRVQQGSLFRQTTTNQLVEKKQIETQADSRQSKSSSMKLKNNYSRARSHSQRLRSQFRKYSCKKDEKVWANSFLESRQCKKIQIMSGKNSRQAPSIGDSRYSSFYFKRPHTTEVGRIKKQNQELFNFMLEQ